MRELRQKQKIKKRLYSLPVLIIVLIITIFLIQGAVGVFKRQMESKVIVDDLREESDILVSRRDELRDNIDLLNTEEGVIEEIKEKFSVSREGEYVAIIVEDSSEKPPEQVEEQTFRQKWWDNIKNLWKR